VTNNGCDGLTVDLRKRRAQLSEATIEEGGWLSIDRSMAIVAMSSSANVKL
jgi:hypothetical protein